MFHLPPRHDSKSAPWSPIPSLTLPPAASKNPGGSCCPQAPLPPVPPPRLAPSLPKTLTLASPALPAAPGDGRRRHAPHAGRRVPGLSRAAGRHDQSAHHRYARTHAAAPPPHPISPSPSGIRRFVRLAEASID